MRKKDQIDDMETESIQRVLDLYEEFAESMRKHLPNSWAREELDRIETHIKMLKGRIEEREAP